MNYGIALGSNLGDRLANLQTAVMRLLESTPGTRLKAASPVYETDPVDCPEGSPGFLNAVIEIECSLPPLELLYLVRAIEADLGRPNEHDHHAPRTVDLDLLYADNLTLDHPDLILPHPRMPQRRFVLRPLADIRPALKLPGQIHEVQTLLAQLESDEPPLRLFAQSWFKPSP